MPGLVLIVAPYLPVCENPRFRIPNEGPALNGVSGVFKTFYAPAITGVSSESESLTVDSVMGRRLNSVAMDETINGNAHPNGSNADWRKANGLAE